MQSIRTDQLCTKNAMCSCSRASTVRPSDTRTITFNIECANHCKSVKASKGIILSFILVD